MNRSLRAPTLLLVTALFAAACGGGGGGTAAPATSGASGEPATSGEPASPGAAGEINVMSLWGGSEEEAFKKVLADFKAKTGISAKYEADRQTYSTILQSDHGRQPA